MSNLSGIGFDVKNQEDFEFVISKAYEKATGIETDLGIYAVYTDNTGAQLWIQLNKNDEIIGVNPHYSGKSNRTVCLTGYVDRPESELDGAFHAWAEPTKENKPDSGIYPFVFDVPDFKTLPQIPFPRNQKIQLTAFAHEISYFESEDAYENSPGDEPKFAVQSFIPSGLFSPDGSETPTTPQSYCIFTGVVQEVKKFTNELTSQDFYWMLVNTLGGQVDVVADIDFFSEQPVIKSVIQGQFWLSGRLLDMQ